MFVTVLESQCLSKSAGTDGADRLLVADGLWGVVDGSSAKGPGPDSGATGADLADIVATSVNDIPPAADAMHAFAVLTLALVDRAAPGFRDSAAIVMYSEFRNEVWLLGSGGFCVDGQVTTFSPSHEAAASRVRAAFLTARLGEGSTVEELAADDQGRELILGLLREEHRLRNVDEPGAYYFGGLDGRPVPRRHIAVHSLSRDARDLTMVTDGYPVVDQTLAGCERSLADLLEHDPLLIGRHPQTKGVRPGDRSFDDRALMRLIRA